MARGARFSATLAKQVGATATRIVLGSLPRDPSPPTCTSQSFLSSPLGPQGHGKTCTESQGVDECQALQFGQELDGLESCAILESSWRRGDVGPETLSAVYNVVLGATGWQRSILSFYSTKTATRTLHLPCSTPRRGPGARAQPRQLLERSQTDGVSKCLSCPGAAATRQPVGGPGPWEVRGPVCSRAGRSVLVGQALTGPVFSSPAGTGPAYTTDPLLSLLLLALHKLLGQLVGQ